MIVKFGAVKIRLSGLLITGISNVMFRAVDKLNGDVLFYSLLVILRMVEGLDFTMVQSSGIFIISCKFSENVARAFTVNQAFNSMDYI